MNNHSRALGFLTVLLLAGCVGKTVEWRHPTLPAEQWSADAAQCRYEAQRMAEEQFFRNEPSETTMSDDTTVDTMLDRAQLKKMARPLFADCMTELGYVSAE